MSMILVNMLKSFCAGLNNDKYIEYKEKLLAALEEEDKNRGI